LVVAGRCHRSLLARLEDAAARGIVHQLRAHVQLRGLEVDRAVRQVAVDGVLQHARARGVGADGRHLLLRGLARERVDGVARVVGAGLGVGEQRQQLEDEGHGFACLGGDWAVDGGNGGGGSDGKGGGLHDAWCEWWGVVALLGEMQVGE